MILLHQHSDAEADERIALLERVITGYHLLFAAQGVELAVPRQRLVSAWFADQKDYLDFLRSEDATAFATTRGYFHPTWQAVVAYDARSHNEQRSARNKLAAKRDELAAIWRNGRTSTSAKPGEDQAGRRAVANCEPCRGQGAARADWTEKSPARRCFWTWIGGRSTWERRPTR